MTGILQLQIILILLLSMSCSTMTETVHETFKVVAVMDFFMQLGLFDIDEFTHVLQHKIAAFGLLSCLVVYNIQQLSVSLTQIQHLSPPKIQHHNIP